MAARVLAVLVLLTTVVVLGMIGCDRGARETSVSPAPEPASDDTQQPPADPATTTTANYSITSKSATVSVGEPGKFAIGVQPNPGYKINLDYPWAAKLASDPQLTVEPKAGKDKWTLAEKGARLEMPVTAREAGNHELKAKVSFSVCNDKACDVIRDKEVVVKVAAK